MKSLLVDVLREAQDEPSEDNSSPIDAEDQPSVDESLTDVAVSHADLELMTTGQLRTGEAVDEDSSDEASSIPVDGSAVPDAMALPTRRRPMADTAVLSELGAVLPAKRPLILQIGHMTPHICLVAVVGVVAGTLFVNRATRSSLNDGLGEIAIDVQTTNQGDATDRAGGRSNVFRATLNDGGAAAKVVTLAGTPVATGAAGPVSALGVPGNTGSVTTIDVSPVDAGRSAVDDRAFGLVTAGYAAYQQRDFRGAEQYYDRALAIEANHRDALLGIAAVYGQTDRESLALDAYRKVLHIEPDNTIAASAILSAHSATLSWDNESELKLLLQQYPDAHHLHFALGKIYVDEQRWAAARHAFLAAWQLAPANPNYAYNLAVSLERLGDVVEAARYFETALVYADESSSVDREAVEMHLNQLAIIARDDR